VLHFFPTLPQLLPDTPNCLQQVNNNFASIAGVSCRISAHNSNGSISVAQFLITGIQLAISMGDSFSR